MGIVKITDQLHEQLRLASAAMDRSINAQAEFWIKIGLLAELNPHLPYNELINKLLLDKPDLIRGRTNPGEPQQHLRHSPGQPAYAG